MKVLVHAAGACLLVSLGLAHAQGAFGPPSAESCRAELQAQGVSSELDQRVRRCVADGTRAWLAQRQLQSGPRARLTPAERASAQAVAAQLPPVAADAVDARTRQRICLGGQVLTEYDGRFQLAAREVEPGLPAELQRYAQRPWFWQVVESWGRTQLASAPELASSCVAIDQRSAITQLNRTLGAPVAGGVLVTRAAVEAIRDADARVQGERATRDAEERERQWRQKGPEGDQR